MADKNTQTLLALLLQRAKAITGTVPDAIFNIPGVQYPVKPGTGNDISSRDVTRAGLPGILQQTRFSDLERDPNYSGKTNWWSGTSTPDLDPRLIDPNNNPMESESGLNRGDIDLDTGREDLHRLLDYYTEVHKRFK